MKSKMILAVEALLVSSLVLGACVLPTIGASGYLVNLTSPETGAIYPLGTAVTLRGSLQNAASLPNATQFTFWANGTQVGQTTTLDVAIVGGNAFATGRFTWTPPAVGEYLVQTQATMSSSRIAISSAHRICVLDLTLPFTWAGGSGYTGPCPLPPPPAITPSDTTVSMSASAEPASILFEGVPRLASCPPSVTFTAHLHDPAGRVGLVLVAYNGLDPSGVGGGDTLALNETSALGLPDRIFSGSPSERLLEAILSGNLVDSADNSIAGTLDWEARAFDRTGAVLATVGPNEIPAAPCGVTLPTPHVIQPFPTDTSTATATATATSTFTPTPVNCPKGTMLIPSLGNGCYFVTRTPKPRGTVAAACSSYHNPSACTSNGCGWDKGTSTCH